MSTKQSIRFYKDREVRAIWNDEQSKWFFSIVDIVAAITESPRPRVYWGTVKNRQKAQYGELYSKCIQLKLPAVDGKRYATDCFAQEDIIEVVKTLPAKNTAAFLDWFTYSDNTIDGQSRKKAYTFWESNMISDAEVGTVKALQKIHAYLFGGLYDFAGKIRQVNIAHPFREGNGRSTRIWLDLIFKKRLQRCVDWSRIPKNEYLDAMIRSAVDASAIRRLLRNALTDQINDRELFMKGIDYSYYYEQND